MVQQASLLATVLFLIPVVTFVALRLRKDSELWEIALDIPIALALDFFSVLTLAFVLRLDVATLVSRAVWLIGGLGYLVFLKLRRPDALRWPKELKPRVLGAAGVGATTTVWLSQQASRRYSIFDRHWHIPLVASLRGQTVPFHNVFNPHQRLFYHFSGDVHAAMLQTLSFAVIHSALALSLAHDIHFGLIGFMLGLLLSWAGYRRFVAFALCPLAILTAGPMTIFRGGVRTAQQGYSIINVFSLSFRPHMALGDLLMIAFVMTAVVRLASDREPPPLKTIVPLISCAAVLALTDETSLGVNALALGIVWLVCPRVVHPRRWKGVLVFLALAAALVLPNLIFSGALNPGSQHHHFSIVPWRSPGCYTPLLPLSTHKGKVMLLYDVFPTVAMLVGVAILWFARCRSRDHGVLVLFLLLVVTISIVTLTHIDMDHEPVENHRFMLAAEVVAPLIGVLFLAPGWVQRRFTVSPYASALIVAGMLAGSLSTADWLWWLCPTWLRTYKQGIFGAHINHYQVDCRTEAGARLGMRPKLYYLAPPVAYLYSGCVPLYTPGVGTHRDWKLTIGAPMYGPRGVQQMEKWAHPNKTLSIVCPQGARQSDVPCRNAVKHGACKNMGQYVQLCHVSAKAEQF